MIGCFDKWRGEPTMATQVVAKKHTKPIPTMSRSHPIMGNMSEYNNDRLNFLMRVARQCGDIGKFHYGFLSLILFNAPEFVQSVFVEHTYDFDKGAYLRSAFYPVTGNGLFISEGEIHRKQRKLMAPTFQPRQIVSYADTMVGYGERILETWRDGMTVDVSQEMTDVTMSIVGKVLFDADVFTETDELGAAMTAALNHVAYMFSTAFPLPFNWPLPRYKRTKQAIALLRQRIQKMIDERRASAEQGNDLLSILLQAREEDGSGMSDEQVRAEAMTLFGAGHETTANALTWAWYLLTTHPDAYQKMQQEIDTVLQGRSPTYADLAHLPYTLQVLKEALRLYPPAYAISRGVLHDTEINGYFISKRALVMVAPWVLHRRPDFFPDPEKFDPERFTLENEKRLPRYAYMPFGAGPRICIGNHFAMMEGHLLLATLAQRVTFELVAGQNIVPQPGIGLRPKYGLKMVVQRRNPTGL